MKSYLLVVVVLSISTALNVQQNIGYGFTAAPSEIGVQDIIDPCDVLEGWPTDSV